MAESSVVVPAAELDRLIYVAIAGARDDAETDLLAGLARHVVERQPDVSAAELTQRDRRAAGRHRRAPAGPGGRPRPEHLAADEPAAHPGRPGADHAVGARGGRATTPGRSSAATAPAPPLRRQVAPLDLQFDRFGQVERFRRETWQALYDQAKERPAVAEAVDGGPIGEALGVQTTQHAVAMLGVAELEPLRQFVLDRIQRERRHHRGPPGPRRHAGQRRRDDDRTGRRVRGQHEVAQHRPAGQRGGHRHAPGPQPEIRIRSSRRRSRRPRRSRRSSTRSSIRPARA